MDWCEDNSVTYVFGLTGTKALEAKVKDIVDTIRVGHAVGNTLCYNSYLTRCMLTFG